MKRSDINVGDHLALFTGYRSQRPGFGASEHDSAYNWKRVRVLDVGPVARQRKNSWDYSRSNRSVIDGVSVQPLKGNGQTDGDVRVVALKDLVCTWAEHRAAAEEARADSERRRRDLDERAQRANDATREIKRLVPSDLLPYWVENGTEVHADYSGLYGGSGTMSVEELLAIVDHVRETARQDGIEAAQAAQ